MEPTTRDWALAGVGLFLAVGGAISLVMAAISLVTGWLGSDLFISGIVWSAVVGTVGLYLARLLWGSTIWGKRGQRPFGIG